jgi:hypothetical protein
LLFEKESAPRAREREIKEKDRRERPCSLVPIICFQCTKREREREDRREREREDRREREREDRRERERREDENGRHGVDGWDSAHTHVQICELCVTMDVRQ